MAVYGLGGALRTRIRKDVPNRPVTAGIRREGRKGWLWVQEYVLPGEEAACWSVVEPDGRWVTDVEIPTAWRVQDIGRDYVLSVVRMPLEVEHVELFALAGRG